MPLQCSFVGTLYVVATPIGNLEDVTLRALRILREASLVLAEDTRRTRILLDRHAIAARPVSLHAHNEAARCASVLAALAAGQSVALVSDAGTPLVSDPGERLVAAALEAGHEVVPIPGPSAVLAALAASGLPATAFTMLGFLPRRGKAREALLRRFVRAPETLVVFEAPGRVAATLAALSEILGDRRACVARELTKLHEEIVRGGLRELAARYSAAPPRGEVTLVVAGAKEDAASDPLEPDAVSIDDEIRSLVAAGRSPREVAAALARAGGLPRRELYARALRAREGA